MTDGGQTVVVPLDGTESALGALPVARRLAAIRGGTVYVLHVAERPLSSAALLDRLGLRPDDARGLVLDAVGGEPSEGILRAATDRAPALIAMCARGANRSERAGGCLGRTAERVLAAAPCPVVIVPPRGPAGGAAWTPRTLLVPFDGTPATAAAAAYAADLARRAAAELLVLHVAAPAMPPSAERGAMRGPTYVDQPHHEWPAWGREVLERLCSLAHAHEGVRLRLYVAAGDPGAEILRFATAKPVDLVVAAWGGRLDEDRAQTLKALLDAAPCPVLITRR